jgi:negative regulator of sigma E activity
MKCLSSDVIVEYLKGELSVRESQAVAAHAEGCERCRAELRSLASVGDHLSRWKDLPAPEGFAADVMAALDKAPVRSPVRPPGEARQSAGLRAKLRRALGESPWMTRLTPVAAAVALTVLFQLVVWSPLPKGERIKTVFALAAPASAGQIEPDGEEGRLVLTAYEDGTFRSGLTDGPLGAEKLFKILKDRYSKGDLSALVLQGEDPDNPVALELESLTLITEYFEISSVLVGPGVSATVGLPSVEISPGRPSARAEPSSELENLGAPSQVVALARKDGTVVLDRAVLPLEDFRAALEKLLELNPDLSVMILRVDGDQEQQSLAASVLGDANAAGAVKVMLKTVTSAE